MSASSTIPDIATPTTATIASSAQSSPASAAFKVVCAWPISSNYGAGSRILYYVLVAACVTFRKAEWLRNTCLAAVLILPAISALQGIVLAAAHQNGGIDLDIFGAFQVCAIGILAAPLTVRLSRTYFYTPGRNIIFLWTILILMGLLALCVEFYRVTPTDCSIPIDDNSPRGTAAFLKLQPNCNLTCSETQGPKSPLRGGASADVFVVPVPRILTFNAGMLLAAGFCIPAILSLIFTWDKVLETNWKRRRHVEELDARIEGANMTVGEMRNINDLVRSFLTVIEIPLFGGVILTIIGIGEANFFSPQLMYMTEPMGSFGQWSPIAGTILGALGSLYLLWSTSGKETTEEKHTPQCEHSYSSRHSHSSERYPTPLPQRNSNSHSNIHVNALGIRSESPNDISLIPTITHPGDDGDQIREILPEDRRDTQPDDHPTAGRHKVRRWLTSAGNYLGDAAHEKLDLEQNSTNEATRSFPEVPGEVWRNPNLESTSRNFDLIREARASSTYAASIRSTSDIGPSSPPPIPETPRLDSSPARAPKRRDTLEVPKETHRRSESQSSGR
ncbi:hypothetical protein COCC4DRAFT_141046 [Bipolaris maydis ATCC 48331]|uniref:Uncharacterized protein n=2 Tax=Cochliobolus heterostrophus TaxID=5016 RepID=M2SNS8_COCH5|nr:uncharacterized protein COCC4DRAFT_141046 [Bipolaris maydis ATCC 48331]EMD86970.1 hypothetical protein COCHEDRAFT_1185278 [Bipolaris maydis C5]KAJ5021689.1 hypothetical protein J3E73DRAFT_402933 [Bipolaris maydis]ENI04035.1 hypothetical protein COCC4DRAFT_141046 [Bipolaris maydis ATCC 48331]KAJ6204294.1 hypothetical protein PSV09DRAFT_1185278 [Bipolaris maydis]KAJ6265789.1 hypothetical protein PSV08DRAFT_382483 [Bipolaris maydis]